MQSHTDYKKYVCKICIFLQSVATSHVSLSPSCRINAPSRCETRVLIGWEVSQEPRTKAACYGRSEWMLHLGFLSPVLVLMIVCLLTCRVGNTHLRYLVFSDKEVSR